MIPKFNISEAFFMFTDQFCTGWRAADKNKVTVCSIIQELKLDPKELQLLYCPTGKARSKRRDKSLNKGGSRSSASPTHRTNKIKTPSFSSPPSSLRHTTPSVPTTSFGTPIALTSPMPMSLTPSTPAAPLKSMVEPKIIGVPLIPTDAGNFGKMMHLRTNQQRHCYIL